MNQYQFSRAAAIVANKYFKTYEKRYAFAKACDKAISLNPDNPFEVLDQQYKDLFTENVVRHLPGKHDQKSHGGGKSIIKLGQNTPQDINRLHTRNDPDQKRVYKAETKLHNFQIDETSKPVSPKLADFNGDYEGYNKAWKEYSKKHEKWAQDQLEKIDSKIGKQNLDGTRKGIENYVNEVTNSDWFIEKFGTPHPELGKPIVELSSAKSYSGQVSLALKNGNYSYKLKIHKNYTKSENTILHEIAHHAVHMSVKNVYQGHGVEFRDAFAYIAENVVGSDFANALKDAYKAEGLN